MHRRIGEWSEHGSNKFFTKWLKFGGILATNISRISGRFLGDDGQYVGLGGARIDNCLLLTVFSRACPYGLVVWQPHWCLAFRSPPMMKYWLRSFKKFSNCVCVILCLGGQYDATIVIGTWFNFIFIAAAWRKSSFILGRGVNCMGDLTRIAAPAWVVLSGWFAEIMV